jgi:hypothetical protein
MEALQDALATISEKYGADFTALFPGPLFQQQPHPRCPTMMATRILREKKERIPFYTIASFFSVSIQQHWRRCKRGLFPNGRRSVLSEEILAQVFHDINVE